MSFIILSDNDKSDDRINNCIFRSDKRITKISSCCGYDKIKNTGFKCELRNIHPLNNHICDLCPSYTKKECN